LRFLSGARGAIRKRRTGERPFPYVFFAPVRKKLSRISILIFAMAGVLKMG
jgi:hypothetical protein